MKFYYYCPKCEYQDILTEIPKDSVINSRGGVGKAIYHSECPICHNLDAGCMSITQEESFVDYSYTRGVLEIYQDIRGFSNETN